MWGRALLRVVSGGRALLRVVPCGSGGRALLRVVSLGAGLWASGCAAPCVLGPASAVAGRLWLVVAAARQAVVGGGVALKVGGPDR